MAELLFCEPTELYNILNQVSKLSRLAEPNYLCLLDVRSKRQYDESHVITARRVKKKDNQYLIPESVDLECVRYCIVYDSNTSSLELRIRRRGGYECFSGLYHFFRTQKIIWMPQELDAFQPYPAEIMPGKIFLGKFSQACNAKIHKDLKIKAHVNVSMEATPYSFRHICHFMELHLRLHSVILVFSTQGISRSSAAVRSWAHVKKCKNNMRPNRGLVAQLLEWEKTIHGEYLTDISDPIY
ncbi:hypothetical protein U0070_012649 [Myodes glareolus]|uniref:Protein-serine/threonine phosphatase n=1 Tax=Myodes glareolus TaxID=447135 RepID=A0AAW0JRH5_MYOGA